MAKDWMSKLSKLPGVVDLATLPSVHSTVIRTRSPSFNFLFGNGWGLPLGFSLLLGGPPKGGKSLLTKELAAGVHRDYEDGIVLAFNTEFRERGQMTPQMIAALGVDLARYRAFEVNNPTEIYNTLDGPIRSYLADGMPLKLILIDSVNGVKGVRAMNTDADVEKLSNSMGDVARTNKEGLKMVHDLQARYGVACALTCHVTPETDEVEKKRGNKFRLSAAVGVEHHCEYKVWLEPNRNKDGKSDLLENELVDETKTDMWYGNRGEVTGFKTRVCMKDSSMGPKGRVGEFTFDYQSGIINVWEELYRLGKNRGVFQHEKGKTSWALEGFPVVVGEENFVRWFRDEPAAQSKVLTALRAQDLDGSSRKFAAQEAAAAAAE